MSQCFLLHSKENCPCWTIPAAPLGLELCLSPVKIRKMRHDSDRLSGFTSKPLKYSKLNIFEEIGSKKILEEKLSFPNSLILMLELEMGDAPEGLKQEAAAALQLLRRG